MKSFKIFLVVSLIFSSLMADDEINYFEMSLDELLKIKVESASKISQEPRVAPGNVKMVKQDRADAYGWNSINDILGSMPGFSLTHDYDRQTMSSRGILEGWNNNHYLMLIDGIPFNDNLYGTAYTWEITPLVFTESLEIITGPGSALYGTNATNGVISMHTIDPFSQGDETILRFQGGTQKTSSVDVVNTSAYNNFSLVNAFSFQGTEGNEYESYDWSGRTDGDGNPKKFMINDNRSHRYFFSKISGKNEYEPFQFQFHYQDWQFQTGHGWWWFIPNYDEAMKESRIMAALSYKPKSTGKLTQEYAVRYQKHNIDWNMMYMPNDGWGGYYPAGMWEYLKTNGEDIFLRAQYNYELTEEASILGGLEETVFFYDDDEEHFSNTNISGSPMTDNNGTTIAVDAPFTDGRMIKMGPWFEWIQNNPVYNTGLFFQFASGNMLGESVEATAGVRYDLQNFKYNDLDDNNSEKSKSFSQISPRLAVVYSPSEDYSVKVLMGKAFRAPAASEMFGANTWTLASNLKNLDPEIITTGEILTHLDMFKNVKIKLNAFWTQFENQIAYSASNKNLSTNIFTMTNAGVESDFMFSYKQFKGYMNYSYVQRLDDQIAEIDGQKDHSEHETKMVWYPMHTLNFGTIYKMDKFTGSISAHYQGEVNRRDSDHNSYKNLRDMELAPWFSVNTKISYDFNEKFTFFVKVKNLLDAERKIVKSGDMPFDYLLQERKIIGGIKFNI